MMDIFDISTTKVTFISNVKVVRYHVQGGGGGASNYYVMKCRAFACMRATFK